MQLVTASATELRAAGLDGEALQLEVHLPRLDRQMYASDAANRKRLHYESHGRKRRS